MHRTAAVANGERCAFRDVRARFSAVPCVVTCADRVGTAGAKHPATGRTGVEGEPHLLRLRADLHGREVREIHAILVERGTVRQRRGICLDDGVFAANGELPDVESQWLGGVAFVLGSLGKEGPWHEATLHILQASFDLQFPGIEGVDASRETGDDQTW